MTARKLLIQKLTELGADGLAGDECGCTLNDLAPCNCEYGDCEPAKNNPERAKQEGCHCWMEAMSLPDALAAAKLDLVKLAHAELAAAKADNERLQRERDGWKVAMEAAAKVARDNEAERDQFRAVVEDLAKWGKEYHANHGLPILGELGNIINRASELAGKEKQG